MAPKRVAIIGGGPAGLPSIRHGLLYGFEVVCYEAQDEIGGLWRYKPDETSESSVMKSTVINSSKEMTAYSDFPPKAEEANFMHNTHMLQYFKDYAEHFDLLKYIKFNTKVLNVERTADYAKSGQWNVTIEDKEGKVSNEVFDGVLVCTGHHTKPYWPEPWKGQEKYTGKIIHAHSYKDHRGYEDQEVVVIGIGNSGGDVAVELSKIAKQVYLVSRRGTWVFNRIFTHGLPVDTTLVTRWNFCLLHYLPACLPEYVAQKTLNGRFNHELYGLKPNHGFLSGHPTVNDELPNRIAAGTIIVKPQIDSFTERGVKFEDGTELENVDSIIVCTGYSFEFPVVENGNLIKVEENQVDLYQYMYPISLQHNTLAVVGLIQPFGSIMPIAEMQVRVFFDSLAGHSKLPSQSEMKENMLQKRREMEKRYAKSRRHTIQVDYLPYMDELASLIGCRPCVWEILKNDPALAFKIFTGPAAAYQYRLTGPHQWKHAREAIMGTEERIIKATNHKLKELPSSWSDYLPYLIVGIALFFMLF